MKNKSLRRSLLTSVVSLATCSTMFVGTTFAWFTDSVTSARNVIQSGNLDITLKYWDDKTDSFKTVEKTTEIFNNAARWEPGHTEVAYLENRECRQPRAQISACRKRVQRNHR